MWLDYLLCRTTMLRRTFVLHSTQQIVSMDGSPIQCACLRTHRQSSNSFFHCRPFCKRMVSDASLMQRLALSQ